MRQKSDKRPARAMSDEEQATQAVSEKEKILKRMGPVAYFCAGLALLAYDVYGLATNNLRMLFLGKLSSSGGIFLHGLPMWILFFAYLLFAMLLIAGAVIDQVMRGEEAAHAKWDRLIDRALVLVLILYIGAAFLANRLNLHH